VIRIAVVSLPGAVKVDRGPCETTPQKLTNQKTNCKAKTHIHLTANPIQKTRKTLTNGVFFCIFAVGNDNNLINKTNES